MADELILTGWGYMDYAAAAAVALRARPTADVLGMSMRGLPDFLETVSGYRSIYILGIGLIGDPPRLLAAAERLKARKVKVVWLSALDLPPNLESAFDHALDCQIFPSPGNKITAAAGRWFKRDYGDLLPLADEKPGKGESDWMRSMRKFVVAAMFYHRSYQDEEPFADAIRQLAAGEARSVLSEAAKMVIAHYERYGSRELLGRSAAIQSLRNAIRRVAAHERARVLITGESGTGKETVANLIHNESGRKTEAFIAFNCAIVNSDLLESRLLGYEKGAFTGATERHTGLFEQANGGTLFLDEIGELPLKAQGVLLRVLEEGRFCRIGGREEIQVDVRLITATNRDLAELVRTNKFREDLYYRLNVIQLRVPPLREHREDIAEIANAFWRKQHRAPLNPDQLAALARYDYPGNVRELQNILERADVLDELDFKKLFADYHRLSKSLPIPENEPNNLEAAVRRHVKKVYEKCGENLTEAAKALDISRNTTAKYLKP